MGASSTLVIRKSNDFSTFAPGSSTARHPNANRNLLARCFHPVILLCAHLENPMMHLRLRCLPAQIKIVPTILATALNLSTCGNSADVFTSILPRPQVSFFGRTFHHRPTRRDHRMTVVADFPPGSRVRVRGEEWMVEKSLPRRLGRTTRQFRT